MKLFCWMIGAGSDAFSVSMAPDDTIDDLKDAICVKQSDDLANVQANKIKLFPARINDEWVGADKVETLLENPTLARELLAKPLLSTKRLRKVFHDDLGEDVVHVLVKMPENEKNKLILATIQKQRVVHEMQRKIEEEQQKADVAFQEAERIANIPAKRKRDWTILNNAIASKQGKDGNTAFSAVEYESLPKRFRIDDGEVTQGPFHKLMTEANGIDDNSLDELMKTLEVKSWAYNDPTTNEATRVQFMSAIFEHVVHMFKKAGKDSERVRLSIQSKLAGSFVKANGVVDFLISRGKKTVCVVEAKDWNFKKGSAQSVLGMEVAAEINNEEHVYGVVTNYVEWRFLKRTDDGIERFSDGIPENGSTRDDVNRIAGRLHAILDD
ncbi:hypothetical protein F444_14794 [Phytophthora nicotianae P1976]|nr:hypothetical protein F444_14794 [Phytophthora nicotianae P1976]